MIKRHDAKVYVALIIACIFWGFSFIWTKEVLKVYKPITTILIRLIFSSFFLFSFGLIMKRISKIQAKDLKSILLLSLFQPFLYFIGENIGLTYLSSTIASVIISTIPLFSTIAASFFFKEKFTIMNLLGILVSVIGVVLVIMKDDMSIIVAPIGIMFLALAVVSAIAYSVVAKRITEHYSVYSIIAYQNLIGIVYFLPIFFIFDFSHFITVVPTKEVIYPVLELAFFASSLAFLLFTYSIKMVGITKSNTFTNLIPVFTAIFAYFVLDEVLLPINIIGILIVITGLMFSQIRLNGRKNRLKARYASTVSKY